MNIPVSSVMRNVTMHVTVSGVRTLRVRLWLAVWILRLAALVAGCGIRVDTETP